MTQTELSLGETSFIQHCIGPQLQKSKNASILINGGRYAMNYCTIDNGDPNSFIDVIVLVTGFGSGWTGISLLGYELAKLSYQVIMVSLPGYGNSENPPSFDEHDFLDEAARLHAWAELALRGRNVHWVGHSMGAAIITEFAAANSRNVASITLLDPVGFHKRNMLDLGMKFITNGIGHARNFKGNKKWELLKKFLPKEKSPFTLDRIDQRISEWKRLCKNYAMSSLKKAVKERPVCCIVGMKDSLFEVMGIDNAKMRPLSGLWHNTTMFGSNITAKAINKFIISLPK